MGKVTSLDVVASLLVSRGLGPFVGGWQNKTKENPMSVAYPTQRLLHVLPMFNLQTSRVSWCFLVHLPRVLLASFFIFLDNCHSSCRWHHLIDMLSLHQGLQKLSMQGQQLLETWWLPGIVVAMVTGVADSIFWHRKSKGGWDRKRKAWGRWKDSMQRYRKV